MWDDSPAAGRSLYQMGGVETHRGGLYGVTTLTLGGQQRKYSQEYPRGARMTLKDYSDKEAVRSRGQDLVSTLI